MFRRLVEGVRDYAIFLLTPEGRIASWNLGAERLKQYTPAEAIGRHFSVFYPPEQVQSGWPDEALRRAQAEGRFENEGWRLRKDGSRFWANVVITPLHDAEGRLLGFSKITRDMTARREQEIRLRDSEQNQRLLIDGVQDYAIFRLDPEGRISSWNQGARRIKGYEADEVLGRHFSMFYPPAVQARHWPEEELRRAAREGRFEDEGWRVRKDGSQFWANVVITAIRDDRGVLIGFSKVTRDLTERRRHEQQLQESEENLRLMVEGIRGHALYLLSPEGNVSSWNAGAERLLGHAAQDVLNQPLECLYRPAERATGRPRAELSAALHAGFSQNAGWRQKADGQALPVEVSTAVLYGADGGHRGFVQIVRDLTEQVRMKALEEEGQRLHHFIAMLSHELRNPLAPLKNAAQLLQAVDDRKDVARQAEVIQRQSAHLARLVDDLLDISRIANGKIMLRRLPLDLRRIARVAAETNAPAFERKQQTLRLALAETPAQVLGDETRLTQVIDNLLTNASKFTDPGGLIELRIECDGAFARLEVTDNGAGMPPSLLNTAFEPFVQGPRTLARSEGGLGIGLALVKHIIELHDGTVTAASSGAGQGSRFTVMLPRAEAPGAAVPPAARTPASAARAAYGGAPRARRVLVVDDNRDAADSIGALLELEGFEVRVAHEGQEALQMAQDWTPDSAVLDIGLPGMDGHQVAAALRRLLPPSLQLIAVTGYGQAADRSRTEAAGFDHHLVKPVEHTELLAALGDPAQPARPGRRSA